MVDINNMDIEQLVKFINIELSKNKSLSVNKFCELNDIKKSTLKSRMSRADYSYNADLKKYVKNNTTSNNTEILQEMSVAKKDITSNITGLNNIDLDKLNSLLNNLDDLLSLVAKNDNTSNITSLRSGDNRATSLRIDTGLFEKAKQKAKDNDMSVGEILNRSLEDYLNNYI